ncbi:T9SS type A sorting domain-containing protein [bacterium]|nr:T9SS type A sorting domain-containing protein [bacterium]
MQALAPTPHAGRLLAGLALVALAATLAGAGQTPRPLLGSGQDMRHGGPVGTVRSEVDTTYLLGGPDRFDGRFEDASGEPTWHQFTHRDLTASGENHWQLTDVDPLAGAYSMWCGTEFPDGPGYGNDWFEPLVFRYAADDPDVASTVRWTGQLRIDTEENYDFVYLEVARGDEWETLAALDGTRTHVIDETIVLAPGDYAGDDGDEIQLRILFNSDAGWSDEDGLFQSEGACWADDLAVEVDGVLVDLEDFEDQDPGLWQAPQLTGVGDFAKLWVGLQDLDPCRSNSSSQVAFIDDGEVVPGTGGTPCITWCYGPGGYIVNNTGGLLGEGNYLNNVVESPVLEWPAGNEGIRVAFDVYRHEAYGAFDAWPGIYYNWDVRSTADPVGEPIEQQTWHDRSFIYVGGPEYRRHDEVVTDLMEPGRQQVQMRLTVRELGWVWGWVGNDGTPAPYFDNVSVRVWPHGGPSISARSIDLANDGFPAIGDVDLDDLSRNSIRFDMARSIAPADDLHNDPGDSVVVTVAVVSSGAELVRMPRMYVAMRANPLFDAHRVLPPNFSQQGDLVTGYVEADSAYGPGGWVQQDRYEFDLPDTGFFYPGDVIHYLVEAGDVLASEERWSTLPADTADFTRFGPLNRYDPDFVVRGLPTLGDDIPGSHPSILVWDDAHGDRDFQRWRFALNNLGYRRGADFDLFRTLGAGSGVGNGLGGRATSAQLAGYATIVYTCGDLQRYLMSSGDHEEDPSRDLQVVTGWLAQGDKNMFLSGNDLVDGLLGEGAAGAAFVNTYLGVDLVQGDVSPLIGNQVSPTLAAIAGNGVFVRVDRWVAYGGCPSPTSFDAVEVVGGAWRLAEFTTPDGGTGAFPYAAAWANLQGADDADIVAMPYEFSTIRHADGWVPPHGYDAIPARAVILDDILTFFGDGTVGPPVTGPAPAPRLAIAGYPNPFNPMVTVAFDLPRTGEAVVRIYDVRGKLVHELARGDYAAGRHELVWNGRGPRGRTVASGVYFAEVRSGGATELTRLTLVR